MSPLQVTQQRGCIKFLNTKCTEDFFKGGDYAALIAPSRTSQVKQRWRDGTRTRAPLRYR